jgi:hypothetical protein
MSEASGGLTGKPVTWTRWAVRIETPHPETTYAAIQWYLPRYKRFQVRAIGVTETQVKIVVEYTAAGANSDDIKRRLMVTGISRESIETTKIGSLDTEWTCNADVLDVVNRVSLWESGRPEPRTPPTSEPAPPTVNMPPEPPPYPPDKEFE